MDYACNGRGWCLLQISEQAWTKPEGEEKWFNELSGGFAVSQLFWFCIFLLVNVIIYSSEFLLTGTFIFDMNFETRMKWKHLVRQTCHQIKLSSYTCTHIHRGECMCSCIAVCGTPSGHWHFCHHFHCAQCLIIICSHPQIQYGSSVQLGLLRLLSERATQRFTFYCSGSVAWFDQSANDNSAALTLMGDNEYEFETSTFTFKEVVHDGCRVSACCQLAYVDQTFTANAVFQTIQKGWLWWWQMFLAFVKILKWRLI